ncbi:hypothetical protein ABIE89_006948 [Bradyrhizobium niftali]
MTRAYRVFAMPRAKAKRACPRCGTLNANAFSLRALYCRQCGRACPRCEKPWNAEAFSARATYCRPCVAERSRIRRADPRIAAAQAERARLKRRKNPETSLLASREYSRRNKSGVELRRQANKAWRAKNWDKARAMAALSRGITTHKLERGPCETCGTARNVCGYPADLSRPLQNVTWCCRFCRYDLRRASAAEHRQETAPRA